MDSSKMKAFKAGDISQEILSDIMQKIMGDLVFITSIVYLKPHCQNCMLSRLKDRTGELRKQFPVGEEIEGVSQFLRQYTISVKEILEEELKKPCSMGFENVDDLTQSMLEKFNG